MWPVALVPAPSVPALCPKAESGQECLRLATLEEKTCRYAR